MLARARSIRPIGQLWCFGLNIRYGINNHISETMANVLAEILMANVWNLKTNLKIWNESMREGEVRVLLNTLNSSFYCFFLLSFFFDPVVTGGFSSFCALLYDKNCLSVAIGLEKNKGYYLE